MGSALLMIALGFCGLLAGGELLVRSAAAMAAVARISPLVIGLTVVAFGTSAPELAVTVQSAFTGKTDLAIGNAVGSNIFNVLFVLGVSALIAPLVVTSQLIRFEIPLMIAASCLLLLLGLDGTLSGADGALLFGLLLVYIFWTVRQSRLAKQEVQQEFEQEFGQRSATHLVWQAIMFVVGLGLLVGGSRLLVDGCVDIAQQWGVSELIIGLTIVAIGTSLPEVVTSGLATFRGEREIAVGNVVGSNLFNILGVLGLGSLAAPAGLHVTNDALRLDIPVMIAVAIVCLPIFFTGHRIARWEGGLLFSYFWIYNGYLILHATGNGYDRVLAMVIGLFVAPLTLITVSIGVYRYRRELQHKG